MVLRAHEFGAASNQCLAVAQRLDPREFLWPYILGVSLTISDPDGAKACFQRAALLRPSDALPHYRLGELLLQLGQAIEAARAFQQALALEPESARGRLGLARCALHDEDLALCRRLAGEASRLATGQRAPHELLVQVCHRMSDEKAAESEMQILATMPPGETTWEDPHVARILEMRRDPAWIAGQAQNLLAERRTDDAIGLLEEAVAADDADPHWKVMLARALISTRDYTRAGDVIERAIERHPTSADLHFQQGVIAFLKEDWQNAAEAFQQAIQLKPDSGQAWYNLGHALRKLDETEEAISAFRNAVRIEGNLAAAHANLGELLVKSGHTTEGLEHLRLAVQLDPSDAWARERLTQAETH
jgi:tetratricopeptide (TPR) repeat protein